ncbi:MAG TPA: tetratricopeptide repeat protein [Longimicrobiaceae bacterium]|nr:tetratricopeptide repeat protein [Longimicrobiaceae bacterium]
MSTPSTSALTVEMARRLRATGEWRRLAEYGASLSREQLLGEPELGYAYAAASRRLGDVARALALAVQVEPAARRRGDRRLAAEVVNLVGNLLFESGRAEEAEQRFAELLDYASEQEDEEFTARASNNLGVLANVRGRRDLALTYYQRALAAYQRLGNLLGLAQTHYNLGLSYRDLGFPGDADAHFLRAVEYGGAEEDGDGAEPPARRWSEDVIANAETERALLRAQSGDGTLAEWMARRALGRFERMGDPVGVAHATRVLAAAARASGRDDLAIARLDEALSIARDHADPLLRADVQRDRGLLLRDAGKPADAREALLDAAEGFDVMGAAAEAVAMRAIAAGLEG